MDHLILKPKIQLAQIISDGHSDNSYNSYNTPMMCIDMYNVNKIYRILFKISIDELPQDAEIVQARLKLLQGTNELNLLNTITPYALIENWNLNSVTWYNQPDFNPKIFGESVNTIRESKCVFDITSIVEKWHKNEIPNNGIILKGKEKQCRTFTKIIPI